MNGLNVDLSGTADHATRYSGFEYAVEAAGRGEMTWLTRDGERIAAVIPADDVAGRLKARRTDTAAALRLAGLRGKIHPVDAMAFVYPDREYFEASASRDRENHGNEVFGPFETDGGLMAIVSMIPQLDRLSKTPGALTTDPALPDDYMPGSQKHRTA